MGYAIGSILALLAYLFARAVGLDRDRAFYPTVMIVIALLYVLFAVIGGMRGQCGDSLFRHPRPNWPN